MTKAIFFSTMWCISCKNMLKNLTEEDLTDVKKIYVDQQPEYQSLYNIRSVPTIIKLNENGEEIGRSVGTLSRDQFLTFVND